MLLSPSSRLRDREARPIRRQREGDAGDERRIGTREVDGVPKLHKPIVRIDRDRKARLDQCDCSRP
jgi:hypothetical protein